MYLNMFIFEINYQFHRIKLCFRANNSTTDKKSVFGIVAGIDRAKSAIINQNVSSEFGLEKQGIHYFLIRK